MKRTILTIMLLGCFGGIPDALAAPDAAVKAKVPPAAKTVDTTEKKNDEPKDSPEVPGGAAGAFDAGKKLVELAKAKQWLGFAAGGIWLAMFLFKLGRKNLDFMKGIPKRVLWILVPTLSVGAMVLAKLQADLSWGSAWIVLAGGPAVAFLNDLVKRGIMNKKPSETTG